MEKKLFFTNKRETFENKRETIETKCILLVTKEGSTKIVNFMTLRLGIVILLSYTTVDFYLFLMVLLI